MFRRLGNFVVRSWPIIIIGWLLLVVVLSLTQPKWDSVVGQGEFAFLPPEMPSRQGEDLYKASWDEPLASNIVIVVRRKWDKNGLKDSDRTFIDEQLKRRLEKIVSEEGAALGRDPLKNAPVVEAGADADEPQNPLQVWTWSDGFLGDLLNSEDKKATMVLVELPNEFLDKRNGPIIARVEKLISREGELYKNNLVPTGVELFLSGSATVGRDMTQAARESSESTELWTLVLVISLLLVIYRAPVLALIPLVTVSVSVKISLATLAFLADAGFIDLFSGIEVYVSILSYGAGVDYCLFLIARYREELDDGAELKSGISNALRKVGAALTASAGTVMAGIGMLYFADFGKFSQAGIAITLGLAIVLCAALTLTPSLLRLAGRWAFWPNVPGRHLAKTAGWISPTSLIGRVLEQNPIQNMWAKVGDALLRRPGMIWGTSIIVMLPFAIVAVFCFSYLSYGLLKELPSETPSVKGAEIVRTHFPDGIASPVTVLLRNTSIEDFSKPAGISLVQELSEQLEVIKDDLRIADIRSAANPLGISEVAKSGLPDSDYKSIGGTATIAAGSTTTTVTVKVKGDTTGEPDETFFVNLSNSVNATIADNQGQGTIRNDDTKETIGNVSPKKGNNGETDAELTIDDVSINEGDSGETDFTFTISLSKASSQDVQVDFATTDGSAGHEKPIKRILRIKFIRAHAKRRYVSYKGEKNVTRLDFISHDDPFSRDSIRQLNTLEAAIHRALLGQMIGVRFNGIERLEIGSVIAGSAAETVGLESGETIVSVDDQSIQLATFESVFDSVLEAVREGGHVRLGIQSAVSGDQEKNATSGTLQTRTVDVDLAEQLELFDSFEVISASDNADGNRNAKFAMIGSTPSIRDLKTVTDGDQIRIDFLVVASVFLILVVLLRRPAISAYLIVSVFFSYLVTLGVTFAVFYLMNPTDFSGLDWKVPMFLFTILIAVGEDYNIFLMTRIEEEQERHGLIDGVNVALRKTGSIISSCGIIMAGTFSTLLAGSLVGMHQLGFALAFGVLLDTFIVRPILVPAYLIMLYRGQFGRFSRMLGYSGEPIVAKSVAVEPTLAKLADIRVDQGAADSSVISIDVEQIGELRDRRQIEPEGDQMSPHLNTSGKDSLGKDDLGKDDLPFNTPSVAPTDE